MSGTAGRVQTAPDLPTAGPRSPGARAARRRFGYCAALAAAAVTLFALVTPSSALASGCTDTWTNTAGGSWFNGANWSTGEVPSSADNVCITAAGNYEVNAEPTGSAYIETKSLTVGGSSGSQRLNVVATSGAGGAYLRASEEVSITSRGTVLLTSAGANESSLETSTNKVNNAGTIDVEAGAGGARSVRGEIANTGTVSIADGVSLSFSGPVFTNGSGGSVVGAGTGHLQVSSGTFVEGAGTTSGPEPVVVESGGTVEYVGAGASSIVARGYYSYLKGSLSAGQTFTIEGVCAASYSIVYVQSDVTNGGTIALTSSGCANEAYLQVASEKTLTNTGTIKAEAGAGGARYLQGTYLNEGRVEAANGAALDLVSGLFTNGSGGSVVGAGTGHLQVSSGTFVEGAGTTSGPEPVVVESGGTVEYVGAGASSIVARGYYSYLKGSLSAGQTFTIEGVCAASYSIVYVQSDVTNGGTIALTSSGCANEAYLQVASEKTLTNTGTIKAEAGAGGARYLQGTYLNTGTLSIDAGVHLEQQGSYTQGKAGKLKTAIASSTSYGALAVNGAVTLAGALEVAALGGFKPIAGQTFAVLTDTSRSGGFEFEKGGAIGGGLYYRPVYSIGGVVLEASESPPEGLPANTAPPRVFGSPKQGQTLVLTHGAWTHEPFEYADQWLRCNGSGSGCQTVAGATGDSYLLTSADIGHTIRVQETATAGSGEGQSTQSAATGVVQALELRARAGENVSAVEGQSVALDGSGSTPASEITSYRWEFGDGQVQEGPGEAIVHHVYQHATPKGEPLTATLTVKHGSETSGPASVKVQIAAAPNASEALTVTAQDAEGRPLAAAELVFVAGDGTRTQASTDESGHALMAGLPPGTDTIYAYKPGFAPAAAQATVDAQHHGTVTVTLKSGEVATASLKSHEMTLAEIEAAGIDPSDPANKNVYDFVIKLAFIESSVPGVELHGAVNGEGQFVGGYGASGGGGEAGGGGGGGGPDRWACTSTRCESGPGVEGPHIVAVPHVVEGHPLIEWLILKGKATVLKQFFEVSMVMQNLSPEPFKLSAGQATLNVPDGMSLAPTPVPQSATQSVPVIPGEGSSTTNWIVRGDQPGEYLMSADYEAALEPFGAPVHVQAALATPLHVWGKNALSLKVRGDSSALVEGVPWHMSLGVTNNADVPLYNVELAIEEETHENFDFQPDQQFAEMVGELKPKQTVYVKRPYILVPNANSVSVFNPALSSVTFVGEKEHPGEGIEAVEPPPLYSASAPADTPGAVHLHWQAVPGAEGYEVFSTPNLTTAFNKNPDLVSATPGGAQVKVLAVGATDAYVSGAGSEPRWYAISALVGKELVLDHPSVKAIPVAGLSPPEFGRCVKVPAEKEGSKTVYHGWFTAATCLVKSTTRTSKYEWVPGVVKVGFKTANKPTTKAVIETIKKVKVTCTGESSTGNITTPKTVGSVTIRFSGCESATKKCTTSGLGEGELETKLLEGVLGIERITIKEGKETRYVALDLYPPGKTGPFMEYTCTGGSPVTLTGSLIGPVPSDKIFTTGTVKYAEASGKQKPERFEGGEKDVLTNGLSEQVGLTVAATQTNEEAFEINAFF